MFFMQYKSCERNSQALARIYEMRCRRIQRYLLALSEGALDPRRREKVETHVTACPACASALRSLQQTLHLVRGMDMPEPSAAGFRFQRPRHVAAAAGGLNEQAALHRRICGAALARARARQVSIGG